MNAINPMKTPSETPKTDAELVASKGLLSHHLIALCRRMERERNQFEQAIDKATTTSRERWLKYDAERQSHELTKRDLRNAIEALQYYLDNGDCHNAITRAEGVVKAATFPE